jgi:RNA polymerase sigma-70 factor (ECF subfamily)
MSDLTPSLVLSLRRGDDDAGALLDELYRERMVRFCAGYLGSREDAEDAVQDVFVKVLETEHVPDRFGPWLYRVARNRCLNVARDHGRRGEAPLPTDLDLAASLSGQLTRAARREGDDRVARAIAALPFEQSEALRLRYLESLSRDDIAEVLDVPVSTVKSRLFEGMKRLRESAQ